jgi:hypothetical protein
LLSPAPLFLHNVDLWAVASEIIHAQPEWLALAGVDVPEPDPPCWRWQYLLGCWSASRNAFRHGGGIAASSVPPRARANHSPAFSAASE